MSIERADATVEDLARSLGLADRALAIDGVRRLGDESLEDVGLVDGSVLQASETVEAPGGSSWIGVVSGRGAGVVHRLDSDAAVTIGRDAANDLPIDNASVSQHQATIQHTATGIVVTDLGSTNGTWVGESAVQGGASLRPDDSVRVGSSTMAIRDLDTTDKPLGTSASHADANGRVLFNRSPRGPVATPAAPVEVPESLPERKNPTLALASLLVPIVIAGVMVVAFGSWRFALFALLSPLMVLGNWLSGRRAVGKERTGDAKNRTAALAKVERELAAAEVAERHRRTAFGPDILEIRRRIELPSSRLWERRLQSPDALTFRLGLGSVAWSPVSGDLAEDDVDPEILEIVSNHERLSDLEVLVSLQPGPVGLVGDTEDVQSAARSALLQLATHHGPADVSVVVVTTEERAGDWEWAQWLPHMANGSGGIRLLTGTATTEFANTLVSELADDEQLTRRKALARAMLLVVDDLESLHRKSSPVRDLLERTDQNVFGIVLAPVVDRLPASVATVVTIDPDDGEFVRTEPRDPAIRETGLIDGISLAIAFDIARGMARFDDPEAEAAGGALPASVSAEQLFPEDLFAREADLAATRKRWMLSKTEQRLTAPIGVSNDGVFSIDLIHDGPHGLVAGTTGAGKSEFLRTLVVGLATNHGPDDLSFVLIDYKGGSAFDRCASLPHVVGLVTDLDEHLAERALQSLEAELHHRERLLRESESGDILEYRSAGSLGGPLPRLVVIIDEFATMRTELPDFVNSLVGIAQRGRSLGVHLILATQRPSGAIDANIRANTNLRVCLRVQTAGDSTDVIDDAGAASIDRSHRGRCLIRRGEGDLASVQTAYVSGTRAVDGPAVVVAVASLRSGPPVFPPTHNDAGETALEHVVGVLAAAAEGFTPARRPWLEALPNHLWDPADVAGIEAGDDAHVVLAVADDPKNQRRVTRGWDLGVGHLGVVGGPGSGVTTTMRAAITALGTDETDRPVWVYPIDHGAGGLTGIDAFEHVADVIDGGDDVRQSRLLQLVSATLDERRQDRDLETGELPLMIVAIDGAGSFAEANEIESGSPNGSLMQRIARDGPSVGIYLLVGAGSISEVPRMIRSGLNQLVVLEQADERAYSDLGVKAKKLPTFVPGRALFGTEAMVGQVVDWETAAHDGSIKVGMQSVPPSIEGLANDVALGELPRAVVGSDLVIPFGLTDRTRTPATIILRAGEHALIAGPSRSGRTTTLQVIASQLRSSDPDLILVGVADGSAPQLFEGGVGDVADFDARGAAADLETVFNAASTDARRWVVLVDDADRIDVEGGGLFELARSAPPNVSIVAAVRSSAARQSFGHWTRFIRSCGHGLLLEPDPIADGELLGVRLPRQRLEPVPGRGYLITAGESEVVQVAH